MANCPKCGGTITNSAGDISCINCGYEPPNIKQPLNLSHGILFHNSGQCESLRSTAVNRSKANAKERHYYLVSRAKDILIEGKTIGIDKTCNKYGINNVYYHHLTDRFIRSRIPPILLKKYPSQFKEYQRKRTQEFLDLGLCPQCHGKHSVKKGHKACNACLQWHRNYDIMLRNDRILKSVCTRCGGALDRDGYWCIKCAEKARLQKQHIPPQVSTWIRKKLEYRIDNRCTYCGNGIDNIKYKLCSNCREKEATRKRLERKRINS